MPAPRDIPEAFRAVLAGLQEEPRPPAAAAFVKCFGCGPEHPDGLYVRGFRTPEGVLSPVIISRRFASRFSLSIEVRDGCFGATARIAAVPFQSRSARVPRISCDNTIRFQRAIRNCGRTKIVNAPPLIAS